MASCPKKQIRSRVARTNERAAWRRPASAGPATVAFWITRNLFGPNPLVLHVNGSFHSEGRLGIPEHLARYAPEAPILVVTMRSVDDIHAPPQPSNDDFIILTDEGLIED